MRGVVARFTYSRWDGTQKGFDLDAQSVFDGLTDDLLYHGDVNSALRRMMQEGFRDRNGERLQGLREIMDRLRRERQERLDRSDLGGVYSEIADELNDIVHRLGRQAFVSFEGGIRSAFSNS